MFGYDPLMATTSESKNIRFYISGDRLDRWEEMLVRKRMVQNTALVSMIDWILQQPDIMQSIILGVVDPDPEIIEMAIRRTIERDTGSSPTPTASPEAAERAALAQTLQAAHREHRRPVPRTRAE